jgi:hypothetical protein
LILQALRPELPDALFFTTDLDELLLPQDKTRYTRNLLVASGYDLTLDDYLQADIPPFRNTCQTSIFLATRVAIEQRFPKRSSQPDRGEVEIKELAASLPRGSGTATGSIPNRPYHAPSTAHHSTNGK